MKNHSILDKSSKSGIELSIVIPIFNKYSFTKSCLKDLRQLPNNHEIIVVDNASSDESQQELLKLAESCDFNFIYVRNEQNYGFAGACNIGYAVSNGTNVMFLNNDIRVKENHSSWTSEIISLADQGMVGPTMGQLDKNLSFVQEADARLPGHSYMSGWNLTASKRIWKQLDCSENEIFSEEFFVYFEDTDLSFRARVQNIPFHIVNVPVVHFGKQSSKQLNTAKLYHDSRKIFINKWQNKLPKV